MAKATRKKHSAILSDTLRFYLETGFDMFGWHTDEQGNPKPEIRAEWERHKQDIEEIFYIADDYKKGTRPWAWHEFDEVKG